MAITYSGNTYVDVYLCGYLPLANTYTANTHTGNPYKRCLFTPPNPLNATPDISLASMLSGMRSFNIIRLISMDIHII